VISDQAEAKAACSVATGLCVQSRSQACHWLIGGHHKTNTVSAGGFQNVKRVGAIVGFQLLRHHFASHSAGALCNSAIGQGTLLGNDPFIVAELLGDAARSSPTSLGQHRLRPSLPTGRQSTCSSRHQEAWVETRRHRSVWRSCQAGLSRTRPRSASQRAV
jgi:hypothetical protein